MKNKLLLLVLLFPTMFFAQVGIGTTTPDASAKLEVNATDKGFLPPRVTLTGTADITTIASPATGLFVYNTATAGTAPSNVSPGFYYYDGSKWQRIINQQPDATVEFDQATPTTGGVVFTPNNPASKDYVYVSTTDNSQWTYNGTTYVTYTPPASTAWNLSGGTTDAGSNKTSGIVRSGKVGIGSGITTPSNILEVNGTGGTGTGLKLTTGAGSGKVLSSDANGNASWATNVAITPAVVGTLGAGATFTTGGNWQMYLGGSIVLPPGKWSVQMNILLAPGVNGTTPPQWWVSIGLSTSSSSWSMPSNTILPYSKLVSGWCSGATYGLATGTIVVNNTTGSNMTLYLWTTNCAPSGGSYSSASLNNIGNSGSGENQIIAYPMN